MKKLVLIINHKTLFGQVSTRNHHAERIVTINTYKDEYNMELLSLRYISCDAKCFESIHECHRYHTIELVLFNYHLIIEWVTTPIAQVN